LSTTTIGPDARRPDCFIWPDSEECPSDGVFALPLALFKSGTARSDGKRHLLRDCTLLFLLVVPVEDGNTPPADSGPTDLLELRRVGYGESQPHYWPKMLNMDQNEDFENGLPIQRLYTFDLV